MKIEINLKIIFVFLLFAYLKNVEIYIIFLCFIIIHELSHLAVAILIGAIPNKISINPFGISLKLYTYGKNTFLNNMLFFIAGPASNFIIIMFFLLFKIESIYSLKIIYVNMAIFCFNILPIIPLDGGRILKEIFKKFFSIEKANRYTLLVSKIVLCVITYSYSIFIIVIKNIYILFLVAYLWYLYFNEKKHIYSLPG